MRLGGTGADVERSRADSVEASDTVPTRSHSTAQGARSRPGRALRAPAFALEAVGYDSAGPELRALRIPARGRVGGRIRVSVAPLDLWSTVASTRWRFGDGKSAGGRSAVHLYRRPGRYPVVVSSRDTLGKSTTAARIVHVAAKRR
jgi:hypothetical protein